MKECHTSPGLQQIQLEPDFMFYKSWTWCKSLPLSGPQFPRHTMEVVSYMGLIYVLYMPMGSKIEIVQGSPCQREGPGGDNMCVS